MPKKKIDSSQLKDSDQNIEKPNSFLETEKEHKDWYDVNQMGKQRGEKHLAPKEVKKKRGNKKHSLRKEI